MFLLIVQNCQSRNLEHGVWHKRINVFLGLLNFFFSKETTCIFLERPSYLSWVASPGILNCSNCDENYLCYFTFL